MSWTVSQPVIVPVDFSGMSVEAIATACEITGRPENVYAVHVVSNFDQIAPGTAGLESASDEERRAIVRTHFAEFLQQNGFPDIHETILDGQPAIEIAKYATEIKAGLVVIPSHGYDGVKRLLLGSVAESVIRHADCPVLVLRRPDAE
jgi:nucleotide-binding universal stress UspA family protein